MLNYLKEKNKSTENSNKRTVNVADRALPQRSSNIAEEASDIVHGEIDCTLPRDEESDSINRHDTDTSFKKSIENDSPLSFETASSEEEQHDELANSNLTDCEDREKSELIEGEVNEDDDEGRENTERIEVEVNDDHNEEEETTEMIEVDMNADNDDLQKNSAREVFKENVPLQAKIAFDKGRRTFDPATVAGLNLCMDDKALLIAMEPCQPPESVLKLRKKKIGSMWRFCSQEVFFHKSDKTQRRWISYSLINDNLFCISCLLFTDASSRGELTRPGQGNTFTTVGYSNWKKQYNGIFKHETSEAHLNAKVAEAFFQQNKTITSSLERQEKAENQRRKLQVMENRGVLKRIVDTICFLGRQGMALRGHRESLLDPNINTGNFLEALKYLADYDMTIRRHLEKVRQKQELLASKNGGAKGAKGRGSKLTFLSNDSQNTLVAVIGNEIASKIVKRIHNCKAWALIIDTTPDVSHHEQLSTCVRIVNNIGSCTEHLLSCYRASGTTATELYTSVSEMLKSKGVTFSKLVAQTYDGASNMSGCYNGLQSIIKVKIGSHVVYVHCYAHTLNLVLSDSASAAMMLFPFLETWRRCMLS